MADHKDLTGADAIHPSAYVQNGDPGAVGAGKHWWDTTAGAGGWILKVRDVTNTGWDTGTSAPATTLDGLSDVVITAAASGDILRHNGTNWVDAVGTTHFAAASHAAAHQDGGADEISVTGLSGILVDPQDADTIIETSGPTALVVGAIADGEYTKRVGSTLVGGTPAGGGATVQRPPLVPGTPLDDFAAASLDGAWSANSSGGSFATTDCITQARYGSHLRMMFQQQMGALYRTKSNVDLDLKVGGLRPWGLGQNAPSTMMFGIAALNSAGTGVGVMVYNDGDAFLANITAWNYGSLLQLFAAGAGSNKNPGSEYWLRLVRTTNSWVGYCSLGGKSWGTASSASSVTITVDRVAVGLFYNTASLYNGAIEVDWVDV